MKLSQSFAPLARPDARRLILGSMPGVASLKANQYYAFTHNAFWKIMGELYQAGPELDYHSRLNILALNHVALWDVIQTCQRTGSLDSAIVTNGMICNDFNNFFAQHQHIRQVYFNGQKAARLFRQKVLPGLQCDLECITLPSTSPAHAAMNYAEKLAAWAVIKIECPPYRSR